MKNLSLRVFALLLSTCAIGASADIRDTPQERAMSLPSGSPALVVSRSDWVISREQRRPGDTAVYYMLASERAKLVLSAYIDKTTVCSAAAACLDEALKNQSYKEAKDLERIDKGPFKAAQFFLDNPKGAPIKQAHILAAAYVDGHWFDVHISAAGPERPAMAPLLELLSSLVVR